MIYFQAIKIGTPNLFSPSLAFFNLDFNFLLFSNLPVPEAAIGMYNLCSTCSIFQSFFFRERIESKIWHVRPKTRYQNLNFRRIELKSWLSCWHHLLPRTLGVPISPHPFCIILIVPQKKNSTVYFAYEPGPDGLSFFSSRWYLQVRFATSQVGRWDIADGKTGVRRGREAK